MTKLSRFKKYWFPFLLSIVFFLSFVFLSFWVSQNQTNSFDKEALLSLEQVASPFWDKVMIYVSFFGEPFVAVILAVVLCAALFMQNQRTALVLIFLAIAILLSADFFKILFERPRPDIFIVTGYTRPSSYSFPSGHVTFYTIYFGFLLFLALLSKKMAVLLRGFIVFCCASLIVLIGYSRMYLGVHWPTDVIGGYLLGLSLLLPFLVLYLVLDKKEDGK